MICAGESEMRLRNAECGFNEMGFSLFNPHSAIRNPQSEIIAPQAVLTSSYLNFIAVISILSFAWPLSILAASAP